MSYLLSLTLHKKNGEPATGAIAFDIDDIVSPIRSNYNGKSYFVAKMLKGTPSGDGDGSNGRVDYEVDEDFGAILAQSKKLVSLTAKSKRGVSVDTELYIFNLSRISESIRPLFDGLGGETSTFFYCESGDPQPVEYEVYETVSQIFAMQIGSSGLAWSPGGNTFGSLEYFGTVDEFDIPIIRNGIEVARVKSYGLNATSLVVGVEESGYVTAGQHKMQIVADNVNQTPLVVIGGSAAIQLWKDNGPSAAISYGMAVPGGAQTNDMIFATYPGVWTERMRIVGSDGKVGIGVTNPSARLHLKDTVDGIGTGIPNAIFETTTGSVLFESKSVDGFQMKFTEGVTNRGSFTNAGGYSQLISQFRFTLKDYTNVSKLWMDSANGYIGIGHAYFAADAQLHINGKSSTTADYAAKIENFAGRNLLSVRNDGLWTTQNSASETLSMQFITGVDSYSSYFKIQGPNNTTKFYKSDKGFGNWNYGASDPNLSPWDSSTLSFKVAENSGNSGLEVVSYGSNNTIIRTKSATYVNELGTDYTNDRMFIQTNLFHFKASQGAGTFFQVDMTGAGSNVVKVGIGAIAVGAAAATLHVKGHDATSSNYSFKVDDVSGNPLAHVRNDGAIFIGTSAYNIGGTTHHFEMVGPSEYSQGAKQGYGAAFVSNDAMAADKGSGISFGGNYTSGGAKTVFGGITGAKNNSSSGDFSGVMYLWVRNPSALSNVAMKSVAYGSKIRNGMGTDSPTALLHLDGDNSDVFISEAKCINTDGYAGKFYANTVNTANNIGIFAQASNGVNNWAGKFDGKVSMVNLPTSNAGLTTGDLYVDTAANILANGDLVVGRKV